MGRDPVQLASARPRNGTALTMIGHPKGLRMKVDSGVVLADKPSSWDLSRGFLTNLNAFHGNSGSPVWSSEGVVGLLTDGDKDSVPNSGGDGGACYIAFACPEDASGCTGEYVSPR